MFVGYPRSGHSLVGSLLDAHPDAVIAHELDVLRFLRFRFSRDQLYALVLAKSRADAAENRPSNTYHYAVEGQAQGRFDRLRVIGDKQGGNSSRRIAHDPGLLDRLRKTVGVPVRIIHVYRNPFDNIATMHTRPRGKRAAARRRTPPRAGELSETIDLYFSMCEAVQLTRRMTDPADFIDVRHEDHVLDSPATLTRLCDFLGLSPSEDYLSACAKIVFESPKRTRHSIEWPPELLARIQERQARYPFLADYTFDE